MVANAVMSVEAKPSTGLTFTPDGSKAMNPTADNTPGTAARANT